MTDENSIEANTTEIKSLPAAAGWNWIKRAFEFFMQSPWLWILIVIIWFVINVVAQLIPLIGALAMALLYAVFIAGFMHGCAAQDRGEELKIEHLFAGFKQNVGPLIGLGACYLAVGIVLGAVITGLLFGSFASFDPNDPSAALQALFSPSVMVAILVVAALAIPIAMAFWFAPALIALGNASVFDALKMSFSGCLKNILPLLVCGIVIMVLGFIASIPFFLGWLVLFPICMILFYTAYKDIFLS